MTIQSHERELARGGLAAWLDRIVEALADPARREGTAAKLLVAYGLAWTLYAAVAKGSQDIHFDMGEAVVWSREIVLGTPKHPPLSAWPVALWFRIFPRQDWAYYLLSMVLIAAALWASWRIAVRYLSGPKLAVALALLTFVPFYNFLGVKYNANSVMIPTWAFATWFFMRSFQTRQTGWAIAAGIAAAAVMLAKYWGVFLLAAFVIAAVVDTRRVAYFRSAAPWISILAGVLALSPHLYWLSSHPETFGYAMSSHHSSLGAALRCGPEYVLGAIAYVIVPLMMVGLAARVAPALPDMLAPRDPDRRMAVLILVLPALLPILAAALARSNMVSLWTMGGATLLPVVLLSSPKIEISRLAARWILGAAVAFPILAVVAAPGVALAIHLRGLPHDSEYYELLARETEKVWRSATNAPLRLVGGTNSLVNGIAFYAADAPSTYDVDATWATPWADQARRTRDGVAWVCPAVDDSCIRKVETYTAHVPRRERRDVTLRRDFLGVPGTPHAYVIVIAPPVTLPR